MGSLYAIFFLVAMLLFAAIVGASWWQKQSKSDRLTLRGRRKHSESFDDVIPPDLKESAKFKDDLAPQSNDEKLAPRLDAQSELGQQAAEPIAQAPEKTTPLKADLNNAGQSGKSAAPASLAGAQKLTETNDANSPQGLNVLDHKSSLKSAPLFDQDSNLVTELVARVYNHDPIEQHDLLSLFREYDFKFSRKVHIYGLNQMTDIWCDIEHELPSSRFVEVGLSIQLADPRGAMTKKESHDFQQMALELTNRFNGTFEFPISADDALEQAQLLDGIGRRFDSMAVLNVVPKSKAGFRIADIESCARDLLMSTDKNGIFMKTQGHKDNLEVLYRLACTDGSGQFGIVGGGAAAASGSPVHDLVIYMNVPATNNPDLVFEEMIQDAGKLATWLEGRVVDKNGRAVTQRSFVALMKQISDIADGLRNEGLRPGDAVSRKLF